MPKELVKNSKSNKKLMVSAAIPLLLLGALAFGGFYFKKHHDVSKKNRELSEQIGILNKEVETLKTDPQQAAQAEVDRYVAEVGKHYALPGDERPTVATVNDKEKLKDQQFFAKAENGDVTLIYTKAKLAVLYRPSAQQVVNVSSVSIQDTPAAAPAAQP